VLDIFKKIKHATGRWIALPLFIFYFLPLLIFFQAHVLLWGLHAMAFGDGEAKTPASRFFGMVAFLGSVSVGIVAAVAWTGLIVWRLTVGDAGCWLISC